MQFFILIFTLFMPLLQPIAQFGASKVQEKLGRPRQQSQSVATQPNMQMHTPVPQPTQYHFDGVRWYKYENGQTYVWNGNGAPSL